MFSRRSPGFTLIEIVIAMVIAGFLITVVLIGRNILKSAEIRAVMIEMETYMSAVERFVAKYQYLPGDHPNPGRYFTGNGNVAGNGDGVWDTAAERDAIWPQLYQAEFIQDNLDPTIDGSATIATPGDDRPLSELAGGWTFLESITQTIPSNPSVTGYQVLRLGRFDGGETLSEGVLRIEQIRDIDEKIDIPDTPLSGKVWLTGDFTAVSGEIPVTSSSGVWRYNPEYEAPDGLLFTISRIKTD